MERILWLIGNRRFWAALAPIVVVAFGEEAGSAFGDFVDKLLLLVASGLSVWSLLRPKPTEDNVPPPPDPRLPLAALALLTLVGCGALRQPTPVEQRVLAVETLRASAATIGLLVRDTSPGTTVALRSYVDTARFILAHENPSLEEVVALIEGLREIGEAGPYLAGPLWSLYAYGRAYGVVDYDSTLHEGTLAIFDGLAIGLLRRGE